MNLCDDCTYRKAGDKAQSPLAPAQASAAGAGGALSAMRAKRNIDGERVDGRESSGAPLPGAPNVGYRVPAKPLRFELWGAHEDHLPTETRPEPRRGSKLNKMNNTRDTRFILVQATIVV